MKYKRRFKWKGERIPQPTASRDYVRSVWWACEFMDKDKPCLERHKDGWYIGPPFWVNGNVLTPDRPGPYRTLAEAIAAWETLQGLEQLPEFHPY